MQESSGRDGQNGRKRLLNTRVVVTLLLAFAIVLAGCTGISGLGSDGNDGGIAEADTVNADGTNDDATTTAATDGDGADTSEDADADDGLGSVLGEDAEAEDDWFNLSRPGHYEFDLAGMDSETGEQVTGHLIYDAEAAGSGELTTSVDYEFGSEQFQSTTTGPAEEFSAQLFLNEAHAPIILLRSVSAMYLLEMGFTEPSVGNRKQSSSEEGTRITEATEERTYAGIDCVFVETTLDSNPSQEACLSGAAGSLAPYAATYTDEGELELEVELVEHEQG